MKFLLVIAVALNMTAAFANCTNPENQMEMNFCAHQKADKELAKLVNKVEKKCTKNAEVRSWEGGSGYQMALAGCIGTEYKAISAQIK